MELKKAIKNLAEIILPLCDSELNGQSRIHALHSFSTPHQHVYVKREDETGFAISGTKRRKYASLLPFILASRHKKVILVGGEHSNHLPAFLQLLRAHGKACEIWVKKSQEKVLRGNRFLLRMLSRADELRFLDREAWLKFVEKGLEEETEGFWVPEGGSCPQALPGAASLLLDIWRNEQQLGHTFDHIFVVAGTGMSAIGLFLAMQYVQHPAQLHVVLMEDSPEKFSQELERYREYWEDLTSPVESTRKPVLHRPMTAKSFGAVNARIRNFVVHMAREEGLLLDPVYNAKLFATAQEVLRSDPSLRGRICIVHSGGGTGLLGFSDQLMDSL